MNVKTLAAMLVAVALGAGAGYYLGSDNGGDAAGAAVKTEKKIGKSAVNTDGEHATVIGLRKRIKELEAQLAAAGKAANEEKVDEDGRGNRAGRGGRPDFKAEMERLKKEDPQRYAQMRRDFERRNQERKERQQSRIEFLSSIDTSSMTAKGRKTHESYIAAVNRQNELVEQMHDENLSDEERGQLFQQMHENGQQLRELGESERDTLLRQTAVELGLSAESSEAMVDTISEIYESTSGGGRGGMMGPPPGVGGGMGGPGGR